MTGMLLATSEERSHAGSWHSCSNSIYMQSRWHSSASVSYAQQATGSAGSLLGMSPSRPACLYHTDTRKGPPPSLPPSVSLSDVAMFRVGSHTPPTTAPNPKPFLLNPPRRHALRSRRDEKCTNARTICLQISTSRYVFIHKKVYLFLLIPEK